MEKVIVAWMASPAPACSPFRDSVPRIVLLITDGTPKKVDWRIKSMEEMVNHLKEKKIDQMHVVALPEHRKAFEPLWDGAKGKFLDLAAANMSGDYDKLLTGLSRAVWESLPVRPENKPEVPGAAPLPALPPTGMMKPPALPPGTEPEAPKTEKLPAPAADTEAPEPAPPSKKTQRVFAAVAWTFAVVLLVCSAMILGQMKLLPGEPPSLAVGLASYGAGTVAGLGVGAFGFFALDAVGGELLARLACGCGVVLGIGLLVPLELLPRQEEVVLPSKPSEKPLELDEELPAPLPAVKSAAVAQPVVAKPAFPAPKPRDGCPGCGRVIPGEPGTRYCMLCDQTF